MHEVEYIEIETKNGKSVLHDEKLIYSMIEETLVATHSDLISKSHQVYIRLYVDNQIVREMKLFVEDNLIEVYSPSASHWLLFMGKILKVKLKFQIILLS